MLRHILSDKDGINWMSKALTQYLFRSGSIEDMHAKGQLSQEDMKTLNKEMVDKAGALLTLLRDNDLGRFLKVLMFYANLASDWDNPNVEKPLEEFHLMDDWDDEKLANHLKISKEIAFMLRVITKQEEEK